MALTPEQIQAAIDAYRGAKGPNLGNQSAQLKAPAPEPIAMPAPAQQSMPAPEPTPDSFTKLSPLEEHKFQADMAVHPWTQEFKKNYGEEPDLNNPDYDMRGAWKAGLHPERDPYDQNRYHWPDSTPDGQMLKGETHPTYWMEPFMRMTGKNPEELGLTSANQAMMYLHKTNTLPQQTGPAVDVPSAMGQADAATEAHARSIADVGQAQAEGLRGQADIRNAQGQDIAEQGRVFDATHSDYQVERQRLMDEYTTLNDDASRMEVRDRRTTGQKAGAMLASAFGGVADALAAAGPMGPRESHVQDEIMKMTQDQVDRDMAQQREAVASKHGQAAAKLTELGMARNFFQDDALAMNYAKAQRQEGYANALEAQAAQSGSKDVMAKAGEAVAGLRQAAANGKLQTFKELELQRMKSFGRGGHGGGKPLTVHETLAIDKANRDAEDRQYDPNVMARQKGARLSEDLVVSNPKVAPLHVVGAGLSKLTSGVDKTRELVGLINDTIQLRKDHPVARSLWGTDANATLKQNEDQLLLVVKDLYTLGVLSASDVSIVKSITGSATGIMDLNDTKLTGLKERFIKTANESYVARGFAPINFSGRTKADNPGNPDTGSLRDMGQFDSAGARDDAFGFTPKAGK